MSSSETSASFELRAKIEDRRAASGVRLKPLGDRVADQIERRVLGPVSRAFPEAAPVVEAVRRCGGCTHARHQLGSEQKHPDPGTVV